MSAPHLGDGAQSTGEESISSRIARLARMREALDGEDRKVLLADAVGERLAHLWRTGGRDDATAMGRRPTHVRVRTGFIYARPGDTHEPVVPRLLRTQGLQLRLELLLLFDAQFRYGTSTAVRNPRNIVRRADDTYPGWRELALTDVRPAGNKGRGGRPPRSTAMLRQRQITEALAGIENLHLVRIPRQPGGNRRYRDFQLLSEVSSSEAPDYTVPAKGIRIPREFFTSLWVWVLSDAEIATYLMLLTMRAHRRRRHEQGGVFVTSGSREEIFGLHRATWRSADMLYRLRLVDRLPSIGRNFRTGKIGDPGQHGKDARKPVVRYKINDAALQSNALSTAWQVLTDPTEKDLIRRDRGPLAEQAPDSLIDAM
ncbi:hypothetical protein [Micromonospora sp. ATA51]|uniref:hypothetical protein n=1 Tax=Micromonospora sp. ATA51 TaxID=2806098 RepID=UPI001A5F31F1|nr:hypothetical protein [Micromonospora sp. ATA51]MBM0226849.1 hypothetical protein [Micromonospora sp. ATA51]